MSCATFLTHLSLIGLHYAWLHCLVSEIHCTKIGIANCSLVDFIPNLTCSINCKSIEQIEPVFDNLTENHPHKCNSFTLSLPDVKFPHRRISKNWWSGGRGQYISFLHFVRSQFEVIEEDAFSARSFEFLSELIFSNIKSIKCLAGWNHGLTFLLQLQFFESNLVDVRYDLFYFSTIIDLFIYSSLTNTKLVNLFGGEFSTFLCKIVVVKASPTKRISIADFSNLKWVQELILVECGIESIAEGVFTELRYLRELDLSRNNLKTLSATMFDALMERRNLESISLGNNKWECYCELIELNVALRSYGINFEDFPQDCEWREKSVQDQNSSQPQCKSAEDNFNESTCQREYGFNSIFVSYPKINVHGDELMENWLISYPPEHDEFLVIQMSQEKLKPKHQNENSAICRVISYQTTNLSVPHSEGKITTICFLESKLKHVIWNRVPLEIWPLNCISFCKGCDNYRLVWFRMRSLSLAVGICTTFVICSLLVGMSIGFLLIWIHPRLLIGAKRVVVLENTSKLRQKSITIFVMPNGWENPRQDAKINGVYSYKSPVDPADDHWQELEETNGYIEFPPLPPRPNRKPKESVFVI